MLAHKIKSFFVWFMKCQNFTTIFKKDPTRTLSRVSADTISKEKKKEIEERINMIVDSRIEY